MLQWKTVIIILNVSRWKKMIDESDSLRYAAGILPYPVILVYYDDVQAIKNHQNNLVRITKNPMLVMCG